jgi:predicted ATPase/DNA-binding SARP family transcriptional activator
MAAPLTIGLFGPMRVLVGDQPLPPVRSRKALWLLALLTLRHGRPVAREWLASTLWPDTDLSVAFTNLRPVIWELRRALGDQAYRIQSPDRVTVVLDLEGADVDLAAFDTAIRQGGTDGFERAIALYRGPLLEGCPEEWTPQERGAREQDCIQALQTLADAALAQGDHARAIDFYQRLIAFDPWRDAARRGLMTALAQAGDINAALQTYRTYAHTLRSEANLTPDEQTTALYARLRTQSRSRNVSQPSPVAPAEPKVSGYLPHALTPLFGREDERLEVAGCLRQHRLVTLLGPGGIGKTRLATAIAKDTAGDYAGGVWLISLENLRDPTLVSRQIAATLEIREEGEADPIKSLIQKLRERSLLLVLDNCEHLLDAVIPFCARILGECGDVRILATSREALGILGERAYPVTALAVPEPAGLPVGGTTRLRVLQGYEGVQLFLDRAQAVAPEFTLTHGNSDAVAQICARLEGVPLALELAAARVKAMTVDQIAARLDDHLRLLTDGNRGATERQQTLRATLDWSYALLHPQERTLLQRLTVFAGGWTLEAAERVASGDGIAPEEVAELHGALTAKSIVAFDKASGRFHLLETVRQYAAEKLSESGTAEAIAVRHREWALSLAQTAEAAYKGPQQGVWLQTLETERPNLRAALASCDADARVGLLLAGSLWRFWYIRGPHAEGADQLQRALERPCENEAAVAKAWYGRGCLAYTRTDHPLAHHCISRALELHRRLGNRLGIAEAYNVLGNIAASTSKNSTAREYYEASLEVRRELGNPADLALILYNFGAFVLSLCEYAKSRAYTQESLRLYRELGDECGCAWCYVVLAWLDERSGDYARGLAYGEECHRRFTAFADKRGIGWSHLVFSRLAFARGEAESALQHAERSHTLFTEVGDRNGQGYALMVPGIHARLTGDLALARGTFERASKEFDAGGASFGTAWALFELGIVRYRQGETVSAHASMVEAIEIREAIGDLGGLADGLEGFAELALGQCAYERSARLLGAAQTLRATIHCVALPYRQAYAQEILGQVRAVLGSAELNRLIAEGAGMESARAVSYALCREEARSHAMVR